MMSGGQLVVLDRAGRDVKWYPLAEGLATLGSDLACDIRFMLPTVSPHHATVVVHANQTVVRNVCEDSTLVNGRAVNVAALRHGDVIGIGGRQLRWEYAQPARARAQAGQPALLARVTHPAARRRPARPRRGSSPARVTRDALLQRALEMSHRASMPAGAGGKQVAIVQPQRRDTSHQIDKNPPRTSLQPKNRARTSKSDLDTTDVSIEADIDITKRKSNARVSPKNALCNLQTTTKATLWIESRKSSPRKSNKPHTPASLVLRSRRVSASAKKSTPLRLTVLKRAQSAHKMRVTKIEGPLKMDHTKQAAIRLMTGHTPKSSSPSFVVKKPSPVRRTPRARHSRATPVSTRATPVSTRATPASTRATPATPASPRATLSSSGSRTSGADRTVTILEITDSDGRNSSLRNSNASRRSGQHSPKKSFATTSPRKSALKDPSAKRGARKTESIKFDLSNLENQSQDVDVLMLTDSTQRSRASDDDVTLRYSDSPSPRRSIHSRSSRMLHSLGSATPHSPRPARSSRGSLIVQRALNDTGTSSYSRRSTASESRDERVSRATRASHSATRHSQDTTRDSLSATRASLSATRDSLSATRDSHNTTRDSHSATRASLSATRDSHNTSRDSHSATRPSLSATRASLSATRDSHSATRTSHSAARASHNTTRDSHNTTRDSHRATRTSLSATRDSHNTTRDSHSATRASLSATRASLSATRDSHNTTRDSHSATRASLSATRDSHNTTRPSHSATRASLSATRPSHSATRASHSATPAPASRTRTLSPRQPRKDLESYSIVDLVSFDTDDSAVSTSVYGSAGSTASTAFGTPQYRSGRKTRSTIEPTLVGSSTPYGTGRSSNPRSRSEPSETSMNGTQSTIRSSCSRRSKSLLTPENTDDAKKHISVNSTRISRASRSRSRLNDSELLLMDDDEDSPRTSKRTSAASRSTRFSAQTAANDTEVTLTHSPAQVDGTCTPENRHSPEEASTPVLSIQSLLDSSQSSFASQRRSRTAKTSFNNKRKTIGGVTAPKARVGAKSKSMNFSARKTRLRLSSDSADILNKDDDEIVTPKSAVKLVPEGVKNKHSTAKKPQSKRSIIDDLNESDIVKQLFNSPVKRKLSQSMTEFSRTQLFSDDVAQSKRATRHTAASLDHTDSYTPDIFVSPISTPTRSPSLEGIKLMFAKTTPENDLRNVRGVKRLLRTPRSRRSIKNDLTNVAGVKNVFAKSPKNRLSDVRVKEVFALSPNNDLRRVTGVKSLFQTTRKRKSPRNELDDVRGVKQLFNAKSPANDLRNVSGVKRTLRRQSPRNDLSDVRGVKRMFTRDKLNDLSDVSGVEELFNLSNYSSATVSTRADSLFDQLVGKPPIRAVYSKTFSAKTVQNTKGPTAKSLHASLDEITSADNDWLQQALNKRLQIKNYLNSLKTSVNSSKINRSKGNKSKLLHASLEEVTDLDVLLEQELNKEQQITNYLESMRAANESKANKSDANRSRVNRSKAHISKANVSRELQKLVTETVEGDAPLRTSRVRSSTVGNSSHSGAARKKSASELYSAHTLPLKKRSLVEASAEKASLPLKKRAVVHSTPVKGRLHVTMNASALARVSPIRADDETRYTEQDTSITSTLPKETTEVRPKSMRGTRANTDNIKTTDVPEFVKPSPKRTRGRAKMVSPKVQLASPVKSKAAKPKRASPVKAKAAGPVKKASPTKPKKASPPKPEKASPTKPKKASPTKPKKANPPKPEQASPTRPKKAGPKKSKKASPTKTKKASPPTKAKIASPAKELASPVSVKTTRSRRKDVSTQESNIKKRGATLVVAKKSPVMSPKPRASRKRKEPETSPTPKPSPTKTRATRRNESVKDDKPKTPKNTRAKVQRATVVVSKPSPQLKPRATRRAQADHTEPSTTTRKTRKAVAVQDEQPESPKKSQVPSSNTRATEVLPKTRGRKTAASESKHNAEIEKPQAKTKKARNADEPANKKTRSNKQLNSIEEPKPMSTRRKKVESQESEESASSTRARRGKPDSIAPEAKTRKRKTAAPDSEIPPKVRKSKEVAERGRKRIAEVNTERNTRKKETKEEKVNEAPVKVTRGRKAAAVEPKQTEPRTARARQANIENIPANQVTGKRKRTATASPVKERKKRVTRGNTQPEGKPAARTRRR